MSNVLKFDESQYVIYYNSFSLYFEIVSCIVTKIAYFKWF